MTERGFFPLRALLILTLAGCASVDVRPYRELNLPPSSDVEVLEREPSREFIVLAELLYTASEDDAILKLAEKAREIGADAIIITGQVNEGAVAVPIGESTMALPINKIRGLAIKYSTGTPQ